MLANFTRKNQFLLQNSGTARVDLIFVSYFDRLRSVMNTKILFAKNLTNVPAELGNRYMDFQLVFHVISFAYHSLIYMHKNPINKLATKIILVEESAKYSVTKWTRNRSKLLSSVLNQIPFGSIPKNVTNSRS